MYITARSGLGMGVYMRRLRMMDNKKIDILAMPLIKANVKVTYYPGVAKQVTTIASNPVISSKIRSRTDIFRSLRFHTRTYNVINNMEPSI
jgi:hypothetical protein